MTNGFTPRPSGLHVPRVPFDLRCVILAALGYLVMLGADWVLGAMFNKDSPIGQCLALAAGMLGELGLRAVGGRVAVLAWWQIALTTAVFVSIWSFFGGAILRATALRQTRDEPLSIAAALRFGGANWGTLVNAPVIVLLFAGFFTLLNMAIGAVISVWLIGSSLLVLILFPILLISSLLVTFSILGGLVTLPMMWAGVAIEQNGALEAVSRTFSYLFARPLRFFVGYLLIAVLASIVLFVGDRFETTVKQTLHWGIWRSNLDDQVSKDPPTVKVLVNEYERSDVVQRQRNGITDIRNIKEASWYDMPGVFWMWLLLSFFLLCFKGYAIYVLFGGTVSLYLFLRGDVDGAAESEIYPPEDEEPDVIAEKWVGEREGADEGGQAEGDAEGEPASSE